MALQPFFPSQAMIHFLDLARWQPVTLSGNDVYSTSIFNEMLICCRLFLFVSLHTRSDRPLSLWQDTPASSLNRILTKQQREMQKYNPILNIDIYERVSTRIPCATIFLFIPILFSFSSLYPHAADFHVV